MYKINETVKSTGNIKISEEVIATITEIAVKEIKGVCGTSSSLAGEIKQKLGKKSYGKGVKVTFDEETVVIDVSLVVEFGVRIQEVAWEVQGNVKKQVESMTSLSVDKVNVHITGVNVVEEKQEIITENTEKNE